MQRVSLYILLSFCLLKAKGQFSGEMDTTGIRNLNVLASQYLFSNTDSSIRYAQQASFFARKANDKRSEGEAFYLLGGNYWIMGDYPKALASILQSLQIFESLGYKENIADDYRAMASIYRDQGDLNNALLYAGKCKSIAGKSILVDIYTILGSIYEKFDHLDSAIIYLNLANGRDIIDHGKSNYGYISLVFGNVYYKKLNFPLAISYYRKGIDLTLAQRVYKDLMEGYIGMARIYKDMSQTDSSIKYAWKALSIGRSTPFLLSMLDASSLLSQTYRLGHTPDSVIKYMDLTLSLKDSLYNQQKARDFQNLVFKERLREQEMEEAKTRAEEERKENIQMVGIAAFIPVFFIVLLILNRRKLNPRVIDFMVLTGLLLFFEFVTLLIHPQLELWTHHTPILMLLGLVAIAAILVPTHHRLERWLIKALAKSHKPAIVNEL